LGEIHDLDQEGDLNWSSEIEDCVVHGEVNDEVNDGRRIFCLEGRIDKEGKKWLIRRGDAYDSRQTARIAEGVIRLWVFLAIKRQR